MDNFEHHSLSPLLGVTVKGPPVGLFLNPHYSIETGEPPVISVTGKPGSGKTFLQLVMAGQASAVGKTVVMVDFKNDYLLLSKLQDQGILQNVRQYQAIRGDGTMPKESHGLLDPLTLTSDMDRNKIITMDIINTLVGGMNSEQRVAISPIIGDELVKEHPSMLNVLMEIKGHENTDVRSMADALGDVLKLPASQIIRTKHNVKKAKPEFKNATTVISLLGLKLPSSSKSLERYTPEERLASSILNLLSTFVLDMMIEMGENIQKMLFIDEAWAITNTEVGRELIETPGRLGRSLNTVLVLGTQNYSDISGKVGAKTGVASSISTRFFFQNPDKDDCASAVDDLEKHMISHQMITQLPKREFLLADIHGNLAQGTVIAPQSWVKAFETTPKNGAVWAEDNEEEVAV